jgi:8-oxo-dGTP pyrophosphatase MutT (NUDIX family)
MIRQEFHNSSIVFYLCNSTFKEFFVTNSAEFKKIFGKKNVVRPLSVATMILTSDNKWIIGRRSKTHDYELSYALVAGYMDPEKDIVNSKPDPFYAIQRELIEETGILSQDISSVSCLGLDGESQPYLAFVTALTISSELFNSLVPIEKEFTQFEYYDLQREAIKDFLLSNYKQITPHSLANILMFYSLDE